MVKRIVAGTTGCLLLLPLILLWPAPALAQPVFQVEMATQPNPASGTVLQTTLNDVAILQGSNPTGTLTFRLFAPDDPICFDPIFTEVVPVAGNGSYSTSSGFPATSVT